jgi:DNA-binding XRE family transcriptional regulator
MPIKERVTFMEEHRSASIAAKLAKKLLARASRARAKAAKVNGSRPKKRNPRIGGNVGEYVRDRLARDPDLAAAVQDEFDRLQLARQVRELRRRKRLSQEELAERVGTKQPGIARLESGRVVPKLELLAKIARATGARLDVRFVPDNRGR